MKFEIQPVATEFIFNTEDKTNTERVKLHKELYGYKDTTHGYTYIKDGLLSGIKHLKPTEATIIVSVKNSKQLRGFFKKHKVQFDEKLVILNKNEAEKLGLRVDSEWEKFYEEIKGNKNFRVNIDF